MINQLDLKQYGLAHKPCSLALPRYQPLTFLVVAQQLCQGWEQYMLRMRSSTLNMGCLPSKLTVAVLDNKEISITRHMFRLSIEAQFRLGHVCLPTGNFPVSKKRLYLSRCVRGNSASVVEQGDSHATQPANQSWHQLGGKLR